MSLVKEYHRQFPWRAWPQALALCPITRGQQVLDLGCGPGDLSAELAVRGVAVTGIDHDPELLAAARTRAPDVHFEQQDLSELTLPTRFDGIWCSFTAAYFVAFTTTFETFLTSLTASSAHWNLPSIGRCVGWSVAWEGGVKGGAVYLSTPKQKQGVATPRPCTCRQIDNVGAIRRPARPCPREAGDGLQRSTTARHSGATQRSGAMAPPGWGPAPSRTRRLPKCW